MAKPTPPKKPGGITLHMPQLDQVVEVLQSIEQKLTQLTQQQTQPPIDQGEIMASLDDLKAEVAANTSAVDSASRLITGLVDQLDEALAANDPAAVQAVVDQLRANNQVLADAVGQNTEINPLQ